jgi:3-deoxy-manno-octulosonate cytidylyltransferase (CMP-KDO synthetase)
MIEHVYKRCAMSSTLSSLYIATCDEEIMKATESFGGKAVMTKDTHQRASDRVAEAVGKIEASTGQRTNIVVMIQGDEPMVFPEMIDMAVAPIVREKDIFVTNLTARITSNEEHEDFNCIKVVVDRQFNALYFSRKPIPCFKDRSAQVPLYKQVCIIPFQRDFLYKYSSLEPTPLEKAESIDMLRVLEHGYKVRMVPFDLMTYSVDTPEDLARVEALMQKDPLNAKYNPKGR